MRGLSLDLSAAASSFVSVDVDSSWGSCKRPAGRASSPVVVDKSSRTALISAGPSAGASAAGVLSSIEPYIMLSGPVTRWSVSLRTQIRRRTG